MCPNTSIPSVEAYKHIDQLTPADILRKSTSAQRKRRTHKRPKLSPVTPKIPREDNRTILQAVCHGRHAPTTVSHDKHDKRASRRLQNIALWVPESLAWGVPESLASCTG